MAKTAKFVWRPAIWASINHAFSAYNIRSTAELYAEYRESARGEPNFVEFVKVAEFLQARDLQRWENGTSHFAPGTFDIVSLVVDRNLRGTGYMDFNNRVVVPNGQTPLPMFFERVFGEEESLTIKPTSHGIKIVLCSTPDGYQRSDPYRHAARWPRMLAERDTSPRATKKVRPKKRMMR